MARITKKRPRLDPTEHPRPQIMIPMSLFGSLPFKSDYAQIGRFTHYWCHAVWKKDPQYLPFHDNDADPEFIELAISCRFLVRNRDGSLRLTGPNADKDWLLDKRKNWQTYAIEAIGQSAIKIGKTTDIDRRFDELQVASPHELRVVVVLEGDRESELHNRFQCYRIGGEWFRYSDEIRAVICASETD